MARKSDIVERLASEVEGLTKRLAGEAVDKRIPTRVVSITPDNLDTPDIQALIAPEVGASHD